jgi:hypothetical protein
VDVIRLKRPEFCVYFFWYAGRSPVAEWFRSRENPESDWAGFQMLVDIYKGGGFLAVRYSTEDLGNGFYGLKVAGRGELIPCPIFTRGPFDTETEITFLVGAGWDERKKRVRPYGAVGTAEENLEVLLESQKWRRRG